MLRNDGKDLYSGVKAPAVRCFSAGAADAGSAAGAFSGAQLTVW